MGIDKEGDSGGDEEEPDENELRIEAKVFSRQWTEKLIKIKETYRKGFREICLAKEDLTWICEVLNEKGKNFWPSKRSTSKRSEDGKVSVLESSNIWGSFIVIEVRERRAKPSFIIIPAGFRGQLWMYFANWLKAEASRNDVVGGREQIGRVTVAPLRDQRLTDARMVGERTEVSEVCKLKQQIQLLLEKIDGVYVELAALRAEFPPGSIVPESGTVFLPENLGVNDMPLCSRNSWEEPDVSEFSLPVSNGMQQFMQFLSVDEQCGCNFQLDYGVSHGGEEVDRLPEKIGGDENNQSSATEEEDNMSGRESQISNFEFDLQGLAAGHAQQGGSKVSLLAVANQDVGPHNLDVLDESFKEVGCGIHAAFDNGQVFRKAHAFKGNGFRQKHMEESARKDVTRDRAHLGNRNSVGDAPSSSKQIDSRVRPVLGESAGLSQYAQTGQSNIRSSLNKSKAVCGEKLNFKVTFGNFGFRH